MSETVKVVVEEFDSEGNLVKRTTTTTEATKRVPWYPYGGGIIATPTTQPSMVNGL